MSGDSLRKRYAAKLANNAAGLGISLLSQSVVARALGPAAYGSYGYLTSFFTQVLGFFDTGTSLGYYTKLSQRPGENSLTRYFWGYATWAAVLLALLTAAVFACGQQARLWPQQASRHIWMALALSVVLGFAQILGQMVDAHGITVRGEISRNVQRLLGFLALVLIAWAGILALTQFLLLNLGLAFLLCGLWIRDLRRAGVEPIPSEPLGPARRREYTREFYRYAAPLVLLSFFGVVAGLLDRWILQRFSGSVEQGYFTLASQLSGFSLLFTAALVPLLMRELSVSHGKQDLARMRHLFERSVRGLYTMSAFCGIFLAVHAPLVVASVGGSLYAEAAWSVRLMFLYPLSQTLGQVGGSLFYATGETELYTRYSTLFLIAGLPIGYILLAPPHWGGLRLGAMGLALKTVVVGFAGVHVLLWQGAKVLKTSYWSLAKQQLICTGLLTALALASAAAVGALSQPPWARLAAAGVVYTGAAAFLVFRAPAAFGATAADVEWARQSFRSLRKAGL